MHSSIQFRKFLALSMLAAAACGETDRAPYADDSYYAEGEGATSNPDGNSGGSAWVGGSSSKADAGSAAGDAASPAADEPDVLLRSGAAFQNYFVDGRGRPLYLFANDLPGANASACSAACLEKWPVFDAKDIEVGEGLNAADFGRFQREDGAWQTTFKGRPLYLYGPDQDVGGVTGDGVGGRWFVARDYFVFGAFQADLTPQGASAAAPYMTNRAGRTVYAFMNDTVVSPSAPPVSACNGACLDAWPTWNAPAALDNLVLPSNVKATDFGQFMRSIDGTTIMQLTYRGWPLYFHTPDDAAGETSGHMMGGWRVIDPVGFAQSGTGTQARTVFRGR